MSNSSRAPPASTLERLEAVDFGVEADMRPQSEAIGVAFQISMDLEVIGVERASLREGKVLVGRHQVFRIEVQGKVCRAQSIVVLVCPEAADLGAELVDGHMDTAAQKMLRRT